MIIKDYALNHWIHNFYGYGSWDAKMWFIAYEEGGGEVPEEVAEKIEYFYKTHADENGASLCDVRDLSKNVRIHWEGPKAGIFNNRFEYRFGTSAVQHGVWKNLIAFAHGYHNKKVPDLLEYQKLRFASSELKNECLIQLYPLPSPHNHAWYYSWLDMPELPFLKSRSLYEQEVYANRIRTILSQMQARKPEVVLMYGMNNINILKQSVKDFFSGADFKLVKATKLVTPQYHITDVNGTTLLITTQIPALRHNRIETGFEWEEFGKSIARSRE